MRFVKAVGCELGNLIKDVRCMFTTNTILFRAIDKQRALLFHFLGDFFTHRTAQQICAAERVTRHDLGQLHDLFLIDHDAVGFFEDRLQHRVHVIWFFQTVLTRDVIWDIIHRPRTIQGHHSDNIFKRIWL